MLLFFAAIFIGRIETSAIEMNELGTASAHAPFALHGTRWP
jgi:hypothetical protein